MNFFRILLLSWFAILIIAFPFPMKAETWSINPDHSEIRFAIEFLGLSNVHGSLSDMQGNLEWDNQSLKNIKFTIPIKTIHTANKMRDQHLCSSVFFDCQLFPYAQIEIDPIIVPPGFKKTQSWFEIQGKLTLKNVTKKFKGLARLTSTKMDTWGHANAFIEFKEILLNRMDFGLTWNKTLTGETFLVGDQVKVEGTVQIQPASAVTASSRLRIPDTPVIREREREFRGEAPPRPSKNISPEKPSLTVSTTPPPRPSLGQKENNVVVKDRIDTSIHSSSISVVHFWKDWKNVLAMFFIGFLGFCSSIIVSIYAKGKLAHWFGEKYEETKWTGLLGDALAITIIFLYALSFYQLGWGG